ncbi:MAG: hypothetical protein R6W77_14960 [Trueperaceae bacterium]
MPRAVAAGAPAAVPIAALVVGALALAVAAGALLARPELLVGYHAAPGMLALTHAFTLGFVGLVYAGTLQQLPAVLMVTDLSWPRLGVVALPLLGLGTVLVVVGFALGFMALPLAVGGGLASLAWLALLAQLLFTARRRRSKDVAARGLVIAVAYLALTVVLGFVLAGSRSLPAIPRAIGYPVSTHLTAGLFGAFLLGIAASGQKLLSMFALAKGGAAWRLRWLTWLIHGAVFAEVLSRFAGWPLGLVRWSFLAAAGALQLWEVGAILRRRLRRRLEAPVQRYVLAHAFLPLAGVLLVVGEARAAALAFALGFVGLAVSGMLVKIVSFLSWTAGFAQRSAGTAGTGAPAGPGSTAPAPGSTPRAPLLRDLVRPELEPFIGAGLGGGALAAVAAVLTGSLPVATISAAALAVGALAQLAQVLHVIWAALRGLRPAAHPNLGTREELPA